MVSLEVSHRLPKLALNLAIAMPVITLKFTEASVRDALPGNYRDANKTTPFLYLRVSDKVDSEGKRARTFRYSAWSKADKLPMNVSLGKWPDMTVDAARIAASKKAAANANGESLLRKKVEAPVVVEEGDMTFRTALVHYDDKLAEANRRTKNWANDAFRLSFADWYDRPLSSVTKLELKTHLSLIRKDPKRGVGAYRTALKCIKALYNYAIDDLGQTIPNPTAGMKATEVENRKRFLNADERKRFIAALDADGSKHLAPFFKLLLLTGVRRSNLEKAEWSEFDLARRWWTIPAAKFKTDVEHPVRLREEAVAILKALKKAKGAHPRWVFESPVMPGQHLGDTWLQFNRIAKAAGLEREGPKKVTPHDLRRTFGRILMDAGVHIAEIKEAFGHASIQTTINNYAAPDKVRMASEIDRVPGL
jgi:integrase